MPLEPLRTVVSSLNGTEKRTRTSTGLPPLAPEASVSTNSTTSALTRKLLKFQAAVNDYLTLFAKKRTSCELRFYLRVDL